MNSKIYLDGLESLDEDMEPGLLSELRMDTPEKLHTSVMSEIHREKKKKFYRNYRFYMPAAAAVLIAAILMNNGGNFMQQLFAVNSVKNVNPTPQTEQASITPSVAVNQPTVRPQSDPTAAKGSSKAASVTQSGKATTKPSNSVTESKTETASAIKKTSSTETNKSTTDKSTDGKTIAMNTDINENSGSDTSSQSTATDSNINLEITASSHSEVIGFLNTYGTLTEDGKVKVYKLSTNYINQLNTILETGTAEGKIVNSNVSGDNFVISLVVNE